MSGLMASRDRVMFKLKRRNESNLDGTLDLRVSGFKLSPKLSALKHNHVFHFKGIAIHVFIFVMCVGAGKHMYVYIAAKTHA